jgi:hypothetical protein
VNVLISSLVLKHHALGNQASVAVAVAVADAMSELPQSAARALNDRDTANRIFVCASVVC